MRTSFDLYSVVFSFCTFLALGTISTIVPPAFADDALSAPKTNSQPKLENPSPSSVDNDKSIEPADVVDQKAGFIIPTPGKWTSVPTPPFTPAAKSKPTPTPTTKPRTSSLKKGEPTVTTIPNPAWGDKVIFRVMTSGPAKARIVVYDRFFNKVADLSGDGERLFDILWSLKKISEGLYYYQVEVADTVSGQTRMLPMQNFAVMKDETPNGDR